MKFTWDGFTVEVFKKKLAETSQHCAAEFQEAMICSRFAINCLHFQVASDLLKYFAQE